MKINADILVQRVPVRFLPECGQGLKSWLTNKGHELDSIEDLAVKAKAGNYLWMSPSAGDDLCRILLTYRGITTNFIEIDVPKKYEAQVDFTKFVVE